MNPLKYSLETEHEVLETLMHFADHSNMRVQKAMLMLDRDCFYNSDNKLIFDLIQECYKKQIPFHLVDILSIIPKDDTELFNKMSWLMENYMKMHAGEASFEHRVERLLTLMRLRKQLNLAKNMIRDVEECTKPEEAQALLISNLNEISAINYQESKQGISYEEQSDQYLKGEMPENLIIPTTWEHLNHVNGGGIVPKSLITIAAGAGVGKTGFSIFLMDAIARAEPEKQSLFFSLEMEAKHIWQRHVGICAKKTFDSLGHEQRLDAISKVLQVSTVVYDSTMGKNITDIDYIVTTAKIRNMQKKISVIVVDYLGLVDAKGNFESNALKQVEITNQLARLAIELDCVVIALSQINRSNSTRALEDRCPYPSDASGSSGLYFSSTLWLGVDRPELYQTHPSYKNQFVIKCRKNRFGSNFELILAFNNGTFAEVPYNYFNKPIMDIKSPTEALFFSSNDY